MEPLSQRCSGVGLVTDVGSIEPLVKVIHPVVRPVVHVHVFVWQERLVGVIGLTSNGWRGVWGWIHAGADASSSVCAMVIVVEQLRRFFVRLT